MIEGSMNLLWREILRLAFAKMHSFLQILVLFFDNISIFLFQQFTLGISSLSKMGPLGATLEVILIFYLTVTSAIGLYTIPTLSIIQPKFKATPFVHVIANCGLLLILSSALPLLSKILGEFHIVFQTIFIRWSSKVTVRIDLLLQVLLTSICWAITAGVSGWETF